LLKFMRTIRSRFPASTVGSLRKAFLTNDVEGSIAAHAGREKEHSSGSAAYISDIVLGGIDGIITTYAVVASVVGADLSMGVIIVLGGANLFADGISMAVGNFLGATSLSRYHSSERSRELWEVENLPDHEREEIREIFASKGFKGKLLDDVVAHITSDKELWVETMMKEELGIMEDRGNPVLAGFSTFTAFVLFGFIPLSIFCFAYLTGANYSSTFLFTSATVSTGLALFTVGAFKSRITDESWIKSGSETLITGGLAGAVAYFAGVMLKTLVRAPIG